MKFQIRNGKLFVNGSHVTDAKTAGEILLTDIERKQSIILPVLADQSKLCRMIELFTEVQQFENYINESREKIGCIPSPEVEPFQTNQPGFSFAFNLFEFIKSNDLVLVERVRSLPRYDIVPYETIIGQDIEQDEAGEWVKYEDIEKMLSIYKSFE